MEWPETLARRSGRGLWQGTLAHSRLGPSIFKNLIEKVSFLLFRCRIPLGYLWDTSGIPLGYVWLPREALERLWGGPGEGLGRP